MLGFAPISGRAISALSDSFTLTFVGVVTFTAAESADAKLFAATEEFITRGTDTPAGEPMPGTLLQLPRLERSIITSDGFDGLQNGFGDVGLINAERTYDDLHRLTAVDGREVVLRVGRPDDPFAEFIEVARLVATSIMVDGQTMVVGLQDKSFLLDVPTQPIKYEGVGELQGGTDLQGKPKPLCFGRCLNISPVLLIAGELVLQVNDGPVSAISAVYDKGYPLTPTSDYATPALLRAATIADGAYATCLASGLLRIGAAYQQITCDVRGDATGGYVETTGTIIRRIIALTDCISDPDDVDVESFANLELTQPAPIGVFLGPDDAATVADTFAKLSKAIGAFCGFTRLGKLQIGVFTAPTGTPAGDYTDLDIVGDVDVERLPGALYPPPYRQRVVYERNWTVIADPVAGVLTENPARAAWLATPYKVAATSQAAADVVRQNYLQAQDGKVRESYFALEADALAEAVRLHTLFNSGFQLYRVALKAPPFLHDVCQTVRITFDRLGFDDGRLLRAAAIADVPDSESIELRVFG